MDCSHFGPLQKFCRNEAVLHDYSAFMPFLFSDALQLNTFNSCVNILHVVSMKLLHFELKTRFWDDKTSVSVLVSPCFMMNTSQLHEPLCVTLTPRAEQKQSTEEYFICYSHMSWCSTPISPGLVSTVQTLISADKDKPQPPLT